MNKNSLSSFSFMNGTGPSHENKAAWKLAYWVSLREGDPAGGEYLLLKKKKGKEV